MGVFSVFEVVFIGVFFFLVGFGGFWGLGFFGISMGLVVSVGFFFFGDF